MMIVKMSNAICYGKIWGNEINSILQHGNILSMDDSFNKNNLYSKTTWVYNCFVCWFLLWPCQADDEDCVSYLLMERKERREFLEGEVKTCFSFLMWNQNSFYSLSLVIKMTLFCVHTAFWICQRGWVLTGIWGYYFKASALFLLIQVP